MRGLLSSRQTLRRYGLAVLLALLCLLPSRSSCDGCGSEFDDLPSRTVLADLVFQGQVIKLIDVGNGRYNVSFSVSVVIKGKNLSERQRDIVIGMFKDDGVDVSDGCVGSQMIPGMEYVMFLKKRAHHRSENKVYRISGLPEMIRDGQTPKEILDHACPACNQPAWASIESGDMEVMAGNSIYIVCNVQGRPTPVITWFKNGEILTSHTGLQMYQLDSYSLLKLSDANDDHPGTYTCKSANALRSSEKSVTITVTPFVKLAEMKDMEMDHQEGEFGDTTTPRGRSTHTIPCPKDQDNFCLNNGSCIIVPSLGVQSCRCKEAYDGPRCKMMKIFLGKVMPSAEPGSYKNILIIIGAIVVFLVVVALVIVIIALATSRCRRKQVVSNSRSNGQLSINYRLIGSSQNTNACNCRHPSCFTSFQHPHQMTDSLKLENSSTLQNNNGTLPTHRNAEVQTDD